MSKTTTLSDIARAMGVAPSTVQRALNGMPGVSEEKRQEIYETARKMGYHRNAMATMLKSPNRTIAVVLPEPAFYTEELWKGVRQCFSEHVGFGFHVCEYYYTRTPDKLADALEAVYAEQGTHLSGVITMGEMEPRARAVYQKWNAARIPIVFTGTDSVPQDRLSCSRGYDEMAGQLAAELLMFSDHSKNPLRILITGDFSISDQYYNMQAFEHLIMQDAVRCKIIKYSDRTGNSAVRDTICSYLKKDPDINVVYSTSATNTVAMCEAISQSGLSRHPLLIGNDLFRESRQYLQSGILDVLIHKRPDRQAYIATQTLINYIVHGLHPEETQLCCPIIVMKSNASFAGQI
ncbi:MAG: LacI family transcriptional regulator [Clostridiales bacterium]|nr:LacI family transcriptional regulator [Clostridiales bacterium]